MKWAAGEGAGFMGNGYFLLLPFLAAFPGASASAQPVDGPVFSDIELYHHNGGALKAGREAVLGATPTGTSLADAEAILARAGARCKPNRKYPAFIRCTYDQLQPNNDLFDDIRWLTVLDVRDSRVQGATVTREVNRQATR